MKSIKRIAIVEDEKEYINELEKSISNFFASKNIGYEIVKYNSAKIFLDNYDYTFDLIFMDINLPDMNGMKAIQELRRIDQETLVIFVTSLAQYAIKGYEVNAFDFIVKPFEYYDFALKLERALPYLKQSKNKTIVINNKQIMRKLYISQIIYIEVTEHKLMFHLYNGETINTYGTMKTYIELLKDNNFYPCNQCYLVNLKYVDGIDNNYVIVNDEKLLISRPKRKDFIRAINDFISNGG